MNETKIITHDAPALRAESNYISRVDLAPFGFPRTYEQLWLRQQDDGVYQVCCIPFRVYGLALQDRVRVTPDATQIYEIAEHSGRRVLRAVLAAGRGRLAKGKGGWDIEQECQAANLLYEWSGNRHIAIDVPPDADTDRVIAVIGAEVAAAGAEWEWADAEEFRTGPT